MMFKKAGSFFFCFVIALSCVEGQENIPFRVTKHNNIIVSTLVNNTDSLDLMFQIAMEDASLSPERERAAAHILFDTAEHADGISKGNTIKMGNVERDNILFFNNELTGEEADGKIGTGIFSGKAFKIDYDNSEFLIYEELPNLEGYIAIPILFKRGGFYIVAENIIDGKPYEESFVLQSGYYGSLIYSDEFMSEKQLDGKLEILGEQVLRNSSGQTLVTKKSVLHALRLGDIVLEHVPASFFAGDLKNQRVSYFGADLLRRFNWIFDADRKIAYIQPSGYFSASYDKMN